MVPCAAIGLLLVSATALHVEAVDGLKKKEIGPVLVALKKRLTEKTGTAPKIDKKAGQCRSDPSCVDEVRTRTGADDVLFLSLRAEPGGPVLLVERVRADGAGTSRSVVLTPDRVAWPPLVDRVLDELLAAKLAPPLLDATEVASRGRTSEAPSPAPSIPTPVLSMPSSRLGAEPAPASAAAAVSEPEPSASAASTVDDAPATTATPADPPAPEVAAPPSAGTPALIAESPAMRGPSPAPWILIGGGALAALVGVFFGLDASLARSDAESNSQDPAAYDDLNGRIFQNALTANVLWGAAAIAAGTGITMLALE